MMHRSYNCLGSFVVVIATSILCSDYADGQCPTVAFSCPTVNGTANSEMIEFALFSNIFASIETFRTPSNTHEYTWRFGTDIILSLVFFNNAWSPAIGPLYVSRVIEHSENSVASGTRFNITVANIQQRETMLSMSNNQGDTSTTFSLRILECNTTVFPGATTSGSGVCGYGCNKTFVCDDPGYVNETLPTKFCLADATWSDGQGCDLKTTAAAPTTMMSTDIVDTDSTTTQGNNTDTTNGSDSSLTTATTSSNTTEAPNPPLPGWAIFLIILGALVLVFAVLFIVWWCFPGFRECLHGVSECFPEDHCCGKGSKDINEETTQKAAQAEDDL